MRPLLLLLIVAFLVAASSGCTERPPSLSPAQVRIASTYADVVLLRERYLGKDSLLTISVYNRSIDSSLAACGLTKDQFTRQVQEIASVPSTATQFFDTVDTMLSQRRPHSR